MRTTRVAIALVAMLASTGAIADDSMSLNQFPHRVEPVLVQVNAQGKVTEASPAYRLTPKLNRLLRANLDEMIRKPAVDKHGKPIASQFVMNLALQTTPRAGGDYDVQFAYVSTAPVPNGSWYWMHLDGDRLALADRSTMYRREPHMPVERYRDSYRPQLPHNTQPGAVPPIQNTMQAAPPAAPPARKQ